MSAKHKKGKRPARTDQDSGNQSERKKNVMTDDHIVASMSRKLDRMFEYLETAGFSADSKTLADAIFENFHKSRRRQDNRDAHLYYDSRAIPLPEGVRPSLMSERRLKYSAGDITLELSVTPVFPGRFEVTGRFDGVSKTCNAKSRLKGRRTLRAETDEFGFFTFSSVDPGTYSLLCTVGDKEIIVHDLELR